MAIGWLAALQMVPWSDVMSNAPTVAGAARRLWNAVAKKSPVPPPALVESASELSAEAQAMAAVELRVAAIEALAFDHQSQMLESFALLKQLADQNTQLVQRIEANRVRVLWLLLALSATFAIAATSLVLVLLR